jgi:hypothetical protein
MIIQRKRHLYGYGAYGEDAGQTISNVVGSLTGGAAAIAKAVSPWDMLTGIFVTKPVREQETAAQLQEAQIAAAVAAQQTQAKTIRTMIYVGAGLVSVIILAVVLKPKAPPQQVLRS